MKYTEAKGKVHVDLREVPEGIAWSVEDKHGIGIAKEDQERIFERFYRVDKSHSRDIGGTGLGLSIVKHAAMVHQAKIRVESEKGKGTRIAVLFKK
ncbi:MAG: ATP-binding protein [Lachnospiraceae bacterium]